ncbi:probable pectinesterase/pectinesterase inhibitor 20 [Lycium ferocissimum]|uniref:probable pectinesterase/pectinesterase inhibitor 20 n=1 Tax=Lycium ferocissimum TaxID=112874 RepID=UPI0028152530|nr:probable pectinesterase/pectinesterase inhibitor 20 [Lycium ferocissimum]
MLNKPNPSFAMAFTHYILVFFIIQVLSFSPSHASLSSDTICSITPYPNLCKTLLPQNNSIDIYDSGRLSIQLSISTTSQILDSINDFLNPINLLLPKSTISALQDCQFLLGLNVDLLLNTANVVKKPNNSLENTEAVDVDTWLSAAITNKQTCLDGLQVATSNLQVANLITPSISKGSMMCSVSLALFKKGWNLDSGLGNVVSWSMLKIRQKVVVNPDGTGDYTTINDAIAASPDNSLAVEGFYQIYVVAGVYHEYVSIATNKKYLMMVGDGIDKTIITGNRNVPDGWTTFSSATFAVDGQGFVAMNITFKNTAGAAKLQAVAVRNSADLSAFYSCSFEGYQDTLYTHSLRQFYKECNIYGTIDFIFGNAAVVFQNCNIYPRVPLPGQFNPITAQGRTDINQNTGISFNKCTIIPASDLASYNGSTPVRTYLGRPWKEYSRTVYMQSFMDSFIHPDGWSIWTGDFALSTLYYAEYMNTGPGSNTSNRVTWPGYRGEINFMDASCFTVSNFIVGDFWLPWTGVPYAGGLYL